MAHIDQEQSFQRSAGELGAVFAFLEAVCAPLNLSSKDRYALDFAAEELFTNSVKYNDGTGPISVRLSVRDRTLSLQLEDRDVAEFDPASARDPKVQAGIEEREPGGLGLHLVRSMFHSLDYHYQDRVLIVTATKQLED